MHKSVWLTHTDSQVLRDRDCLAVGLARLAELGFDTVYPSVWQRGYTLYPSQIAAALTGAAVVPDAAFQGRDVLAELIEIGTPLNLRIVPWFEYGLMVPPRSPFACNHPDLLTLDIDRNLQRRQGTNGQLDPQAWLNPCHERVRQFIVALISDVVARYPVAGIQLDDHFCFPQELGYDSTTVALFRAHHGSNSAPPAHNSPQWLTWGSQRLTELLTQIVNSVKSIRRECIVSISPNPLNFSRTRYLADWQEWANLGLIDELILQVYRDRLLPFKLELSKPEVTAIKHQIPTSIGILTGLKHRPISNALIAHQINTIAANGFAGYCCFFYETLFHEQLDPIVERSPAQLSAIFGTN